MERTTYRYWFERQTDGRVIAGDMMTAKSVYFDNVDSVATLAGWLLLKHRLSMYTHQVIICTSFCEYYVFKKNVKLNWTACG